MGLSGSGRPGRAMTAPSHDSVAVGSLNSVSTLASNGAKSCGESPAAEAAGSLEEAASGGGIARVRRKRRHTCPDYQQSPSPLENGWHGTLCGPGGGRLSPPLRLNSLDACLERAGGDRGANGANGDGAAITGCHQDKPPPVSCVKSECGGSPAAPADGLLLGNGDRSAEPPVADGDKQPKQEPPDRPAVAPPPPPPPLPSPLPSPPPPPPPPLPPPPPPPPVADTRKRNLTETEKLFLNSECHKTEILASKLRHTACRLSGAAAAAAQPPVLLPNGDEPTPAAKRRRRGPAPRRPRRRSEDSPATDSESDGPPHLEPEAPLSAAARPRGRHRRGTPAPQLREAESEADAVTFSFQAPPDAEEWFRTFTRQEAGCRAVEDFSWAAAGGGQLLPYQMSADELFPRELVPAGGRQRPLRPPTLPDRWLPPLPAAAAAAETARAAGRKRVPAAWLCLEELCRVLECDSDTEPAASEVQPPAAELAAALTSWPAAASLPELADALSGDLCHWAETASEPSRPPSSADDTSSVSTDASTGGGGRRRPMKRRKNRTGWPRARVRKSSLLKTAVSRAAAEAGAGADTDRDTPGPS